MYRVIIADDEPWALYRIQNLIDWTTLDFEIAGTATDGLNALELIKEKQPQLLLSDIRMPGLDGLQLIRELKQTSPHTLVIFISGFSDFSYAQEALRQGVFDYLVKPVKKEDLTRTLEQVAQRLSEMHSLSGSSREHDLFFSLFDSEHPCSASGLLEAMRCKQSFPGCCLVTALYEDPLEGPLIQKNPDCPPSLSLRTGIKQKSILLQLDLPVSRELLKEKIPADSALYTGISAVCPIDTDFSLLLRQSKIALLTAALHRTGEPLFYSQDIPSQSGQILLQFSSALRSNDRATMLALLDRLELSARDFQIDVLLDISNRIAALLREYRYGGYEALEIHHWQELTPENPLELLISPLRSALRQPDTAPTLAPTQLHQILEMIEANYMREIRLTDVAKQFYLSPNYLSILIKKETGLTFSELLIQKRIALAKKMLAQTSLPIQDIMEQVGYKDYSCFIKLFKKHTGSTPYAYRKATGLP